MNFITLKEYKEITGEDTDAKLLSKAEAEVNSLCYGRIYNKNLTEFQINSIKKAICYHAEWLDQYQDYMDSPISGYSIGDVSINFDSNSKNIVNTNGVKTSNFVYSFINQTGLNTRRII